MPHETRSAARAAGLLALVTLVACATGAQLQPERSGAAGAPPRYSVAHSELFPDELTIPLEIHDMRPFVATTVNGRPVGNFLFDTGATGIAIDEDLANELRLSPIAPTRIGGVTAMEIGTVRGLDALAVGDLLLDSDIATVSSLRVGGLEADRPGIVGLDALGGGPLTIDLERRRLTMYNPARFQPPANAEPRVVRYESGLPYIAAKLEGDETVWLLLDTGAGTPLVLWRSFVQTHADVLTVPQKGWGLASGAGGGEVVMVSQVRRLRLFGREFQNLTTTIQNRPSWLWQHPRAAGIVGAEILQSFRLTIRPESHLIWAEPS